MSEEKLGGDDVSVIMCGANDVAVKEAQEVIYNVTNTLDKTQCRVALVGVPSRFDLVEWSCVNREVQKINEDPKEVSVKYTNVSFDEVNKAERHFYYHIPSYPCKELIDSI